MIGRLIGQLAGRRTRCCRFIGLAALQLSRTLRSVHPHSAATYASVVAGCARANRESLPGSASLYLCVTRPKPELACTSIYKPPYSTYIGYSSISTQYDGAVCQVVGTPLGRAPAGVPRRVGSSRRPLGRGAAAVCPGAPGAWQCLCRRDFPRGGLARLSWSWRAASWRGARPLLSPPPRTPSSPPPAKWIEERGGWGSRHTPLAYGCVGGERRNGARSGHGELRRLTE